MEQQIPTKDEVLAYLERDRNWGRWGEDDQVGAVNLITPEKRLAAARLVQSGRAVSLSREFPVTPAPNNPTPAQHYMKIVPRGDNSGHAADYYGVSYHGTATTHLDALCHVWDGNGMWNGRRPEEAVTMDGARWGSVEHWKEGLTTRGVLLDVPRYRGEPYVTMGKAHPRLGTGRHRPGPGGGSAARRCAAGVRRAGKTGTPTAIRCGAATRRNAPACI